MKRKIAAIMAADVAGYSKLVAEDEEETLRRLASHRAVFDDLVARWGGRIFNTAGDAVLAEFPSSVDAVRCALDLQESIRTRNLAFPPSRRMNYRIGITVADVVEREGDLLGDGVNIAARLGDLATPGAICVSRAVYEQVAGKVSVTFADLGQQQVKNIPSPIHAYGIAPHAEVITAAPPGLPAKPAGRRRLGTLAIVGVVAAAIVVGLQLHGTLQLPGLAQGTAASAPEPPRLASREAIAVIDEAKVRAFAGSQAIPLPPVLKLMVPGLTVPPNVTSYLGVWGSEQGWNGGGRHIMLVVESVDETGAALCVLAQGPPPDAKNPDQRPARFRAVAGSITDAGLVFELGGSTFTFRSTTNGMLWGHLDPPAERNGGLNMSLNRIQ
ncbi:MAG: adenylate/guanylate cyclase domain-containing protein [Alphaproteobacteria bacterium]|nr:adenylate/guanylate cyclase domain-containing protein [Alphaproteobacteria bacterium]